SSTLSCCLVPCVIAVHREAADQYSFPTRRSSDLNGVDMISVIIPMYNPGELLKRMIGSLLRQTYCKIEILLIDDGSTDNTRVLRSEEHTSELQSRFDVVCRLLLEKKKQTINEIVE